MQTARDNEILFEFIIAIPKEYEFPIGNQNAVLTNCHDSSLGVRVAL